MFVFVGRGERGGWGLYEKSVPSAKFSCECKTAKKKKIVCFLKGILSNSLLPCFY